METARTVKSRAQFLDFLRKKLAVFGITEAEEESKRILEDVLGITRTGLYLDPTKEVPEEAEKRSLEILPERGKRVPLAYLLGKADFWKETLRVDKRCLIPRPETEFLIEAVIRDIKGLSPAREHVFSFLDIGTGSGAIAIALLREFRNAVGTLSDISGKALEVARMNVERYGLQGRARFVQGDLFTPFDAGEKWDMIVSNPPYLSEPDFLKIEPELKAEPREALDGGKDGLDFYRRIIPEAQRHLSAGGLVAFELGIGQAETVSTWLREAGYDSIQRSRDYLGIERVMTAKGGNLKPETLSKKPKTNSKDQNSNLFQV